ncbi:unnamed protein product [Lasius platythorax]|uniref:Uncharacterized protein n=1 Tax=Lasius platythorax TaxID=488582 RepID=A0AAV2P9V8_9HYME
MTRVRNSDRQKALFIPPFRRKFREASSDETGTESFYGGNFCEISDDHAPLTVFEVHFMNASYRISLLYCCILMVTSALSLKRGYGGYRSAEPLRLVFYPRRSHLNRQCTP